MRRTLPAHTTIGLRDGTQITLTRRQRFALEVHDVEGTLNEGWIAELGWPLIREGRGARMVSDALVDKGLVTRDGWDDNVGYFLILTDVGRAVLDALAEMVPASGEGPA